MDNKMITCDEYRNAHFQFPIEKEIEEAYLGYVAHQQECEDCNKWRLSQIIVERGYKAEDFCCLEMAEKITYKCDQHPNPWSCPDNIIVKDTKNSEYGIPVRDGVDSKASSYVTIHYCPWCGNKISR